MTIAYNDETIINNSTTIFEVQQTYFWQAKLPLQALVDETKEVVGNWYFSLDISNPLNVVAKNNFTNYETDHDGFWTCPASGVYSITLQLTIFGGSANELKYAQIFLQKTTGLSSTYNNCATSTLQSTNNAGAGTTLHLTTLTISNVILEFSQNEKLRTAAKVDALTASSNIVVLGSPASSEDTLSYWNITRLR